MRRRHEKWPKGSLDYSTQGNAGATALHLIRDRLPSENPMAKQCAGQCHQTHGQHVPNSHKQR